jgi:hypothetical protein
LAVTPPARHHAQHAHGHAQGEGGQHDQHGGGRPVSAKKEIDPRFLLVVQRESEEGEKNSCLQ